MTNTLKVESVPQEIGSGWAVFEIKRIVVKASVDYQVAEVEFASPEGSPLMFAQPLHPGSGTQPENTITAQNLIDMVETYTAYVRESLKTALQREVEQEKQPKSSENKGW